MIGLAHLSMQQLTRDDYELASCVTANAGTSICFRLGDTDVKRFEDGFSFFDSADLQNLDTGQAIIRIERPENDCNMKTIPFEKLGEEFAKEIKNTLIALSRKAYGIPKEEVETLLRSIHTGYEYRIPQEEPRITIPIPQAQTEPIPKTVLTPVSTSINPEVKKQETQHWYLQSLIKRIAESRGYTASLEEPTPDGKGKVDVSLRRNSKRIAVEIKDTSKDEWELQNIEKCLSAGYDVVIECSTDTKAIARMLKKVEEKFDAKNRDKMLVLNPDALFLFLDSEIAKEASTDTRVKGYRVKVEYEAVPEHEMSRKREAIAKSVIEALKEKRK